MAKWDLSKLEKQQFNAAQARRFYMHVKEGGTLTERDVGRMVEALEEVFQMYVDANEARLDAEAENAKLKQMWWDAGDVTDLAGTIAELEAKLGRVINAGVRVRDYFTRHSSKDVYAVHDFNEAIAVLKGQGDE